MNEEKIIEKESAVKRPTVKKLGGTGNLMYLGPSLIGIVRHSTVFKDGVLPDKVKKCCEEYPPMKKLFIPLDGIAAASKELGKEQSVLGAICTQVLKRFTGGK